MIRGWIAQSRSLGIALAFLGCAGGSKTTFEADEGGAPFGGSDAAIPSLSLDSGGPGAPVLVQPTGPVTDFPAPVLDGTAPTNSPMLFGPVSQGATSGGPCLVEPENDVVYPQNWLRPRFTWNAASGENLFELRLHVANQIDDLVVYTTNTTWTMPLAMWNALRTDSPTEAMTLSVRGGVLSAGALQGEALGTSTPMGVAPVQATGAIVYWTTSDTSTGTPALKGFSPGDESVEALLAPSQYAQEQATSSTCIGCHTSAPDGEYVAFTTTTATQAEWTNALALIDPDAGVVGSAPSYISSSGALALARWNVGAVAFSPAHWTNGDRHAIVSYDNDNSGTNIILSWFDVEATTPATASGTVARNGDSQLAGAPAWSHDGSTIAYVSTNRVCTGRLGNCTPQYDAPADPGSRAALYTVPYAGGAGGNATPVQGASDPSLQEYYPSFSPDDRWLVFNRIPNDDNLYDQPAAEVFVVPASGGTPTRLAANDPPACSGVTSPGITNSWGKWGPTAYQASGDTYYWLVFSSKRAGMGAAQLYITSLVQAANGSVTTHGAIYLWNQPATESNHTPAWNAFKVPPIAPPP
jgi:Tol biopolymer transport system component